MFSGCVSGGAYVSFDKCEFYELVDEDSEDIFYVSYPQGGEIIEKESASMMNYLSCSVEFGEGIRYGEASDFVEKKTHEKNGVFYVATYEDDLLVRYGGMLDNYDYNFWISDSENGVSDCIFVLETMAESFTDTPFYHNKDYGFRVDLLPEYKMEYLPSGEGVLMKKWMGENICVDDWDEEYECGYKVEIYVFGADNIMEYQNLAEFLASKYSGFSAEFVSFGENPGVFVDEGSGEDGVRHYFMIEDGGSVIYEAYLKTPSQYYSQNKEEFDELMKSFKIF